MVIRRSEEQDQRQQQQQQQQHPGIDVDTNYVFREDLRFGFKEYPLHSPTTSPQQIDDLGVLFGQLSPSRNTLEFKPFEHSMLGTSVFPISPRPLHGNKRCMSPSSPFTPLCPITPNIKGKSSHCLDKYHSPSF